MVKNNSSSILKTLVWLIVFLTAIGAIVITSRLLVSTPNAPVPTEVGSITALPNGTATPMAISAEPRILIDNTRECGEVLTMEQARRNNPEHPDFDYAGDLAIEIKKLFALVDVIDKKPVSTDKLMNARVLLILSNCDGYSSEEIIAIENFVRSGGRLLILGSLDNFLLSQFSIRYLGTPIEFEVNGVAYDGDFQTPVNSSDPILNGIPDLPLHVATVMEVEDPSTVILWTPKNAFLDSNINRIQEDSEKKGPFPLIVKMTYGKGYVVVSANRPIWAHGFSNNYVFVLNTLKWLIDQ